MYQTISPDDTSVMADAFWNTVHYTGWSPPKTKTTFTVSRHDEQERSFTRLVWVSRFPEGEFSDVLQVDDGECLAERLIHAARTCSTQCVESIVQMYARPRLRRWGIA